MVKGYHVVIFENDSTDNTKQVLDKWTNTEKNIHVSLNDFGTITIPKKNGNIIPSYSKYRIEKMANYRNYYLDYIEKKNLCGDYMIVIDLDVRKINLEGVIQAFSLDYEWDALTACGVSRAPSSFYRKRYFDTYALIECGKEHIPQTKESIRAAQYKWAFLQQKMPLFRVASAFGGFAIYKMEAIVGCRYGILPNDDEQVECYTEHFYFHQQMKACGYDKIFINPAMQVRYQTHVMETIKKLLKRF
jgi:hypothetical protein